MCRLINCYQCTKTQILSRGGVKQQKRKNIFQQLSHLINNLLNLFIKEWVLSTIQCLALYRGILLQFTLYSPLKRIWSQSSSNSYTGASLDNYNLYPYTCVALLWLLVLAYQLQYFVMIIVFWHFQILLYLVKNNVIRHCISIT